MLCTNAILSAHDFPSGLKSDGKAAYLWCMMCITSYMNTMGWWNNVICIDEIKLLHPLPHPSIALQSHPNKYSYWFSNVETFWCDSSFRRFVVTVAQYLWVCTRTRGRHFTLSWSLFLTQFTHNSVQLSEQICDITMNWMNWMPTYFRRYMMISPLRHASSVYKGCSWLNNARIAILLNIWQNLIWTTKFFSIRPHSPWSKKI